VVSVSRGHGGRTSFHTVFLVVASNHVPAEVQRAQARDRIALRLRAAGSDASIHLGEVTL
jgi:hypothetical protein